jgi:hypothetical protein
MPKWAEEKIRVRKLLAAPIPDDEPCTRMIFPRREAKKRAASKEKHHKIVFRCDQTTYGEFHAERERILQGLDENPVLFGVFITDVLKGFTEELVSRWRAMHEGPAEGQ